MSGTVFSTYSFQLHMHNNEPDNNDGTDANEEASMTIVRKLACESSKKNIVLDCLRQKSVNDLLKAFENVYQVIDNFHRCGEFWILELNNLNSISAWQLYTTAWAASGHIFTGISPLYSR